MELRGPNLHLRPWRAGDEDALVPLANDRAVWRNMTERFPHPYTAADAAFWLGIANERPEDQAQFAVLRDGALVGGVGFDRKTDLHTRTAEIGYWVGREHWGRGIATEALTLATAAAFEHFDFVRLQAGVLGWNTPSCRVLEKAGYALEARHARLGFKDGEVTDIHLYVRLRDAT